MPTARPIIEIMLVTNRLNSTTWPISVTRPSATTIAKIAIRIGRSAATTAANTMMSTISATPMPMHSPLRASSSAILEKSALSEAWPATWVVNAGSACASTRSRKSSAVAASWSTRTTGISVACLLFDTSPAA